MEFQLPLSSPPRLPSNLAVASFHISYTINLSFLFSQAPLFTYVLLSLAFALFLGASLELELGLFPPQVFFSAFFPSHVGAQVPHKSRPLCPWTP